MTALIIGIIWLLNLGISFWNCRVVGLMWRSTKEMGGWVRFMTWMGAIMGASGFSWCLLIAIFFGGSVFYPQYITPVALKAGLSLGYLIILPGILFSGFAIWIDSLVTAWRQRDAVSMGVAAWNTFANVTNTISAFRDVPIAIKDVGDLFKGSGDAKDKLVLLVIVLAVLSVVGGIVIAASIIKHYAKQEMFNIRDMRYEAGK